SVGILIQIFARKNWPTSQEAAQRLKGRTQMLKTSRGIVMKLICCAALVVVTNMLCMAQTPRTGSFPPTSGAMLNINGRVSTGEGSVSINQNMYDSKIHEGNVRKLSSGMCTVNS